MAQRVEDLDVYQKALAAAHEISGLLKRHAFHGDPELTSQLNRASIRVVSDIAEGFEQKTDRHFARYLYDAKGSAREVTTQLEIALGRHYLSSEENDRLSAAYREVARMLSGLINRLIRDDWKHRR